MIHGLMWFPLLGAFIWLARVGKYEYQKLETYRGWAVGFDKCKYDIYSVLGLKDREISWGKPTTAEIKDLQRFSLDRVSRIQLVIDDRSIVGIDGKPLDIANIPVKGKKINIQFSFNDATEIIEIPFTEIPLATEWTIFLNKMIDV